MPQTTSPTIAIVVPVYNVEDFVAACLESICAQTYPHWECFVVDDGSTDTSGKIADACAQQDARIHVIHKKNGGQSSARNAALHLIQKQSNKFSFVSFIDGDDIVEKNYYEKLIQAIHSDHSQAVVCGYYKFSSHEKFIRGKIGNHLILNQEQFINLIFSLGDWRNRCGAGGMVWKQLYAIEVIKNITFIEDRDFIEDEIFNLQVAKHLQKISYLPTPLYGYRMRPNSLVRDSSLAQQMVLSREKCLQIANSISHTAYLSTLSAYIHAYLTYLKNTSIPPSIDIKIYRNQIENLKKKKLLNTKDYLLIKMYLTSKYLFKFYANIRRIFRKR